MKELAINDFYWLIKATDKVSRDVNMRNLGKKVYSNGEIDLTKVKQILEIKLLEILKEHVQILTTWEINFNLYGEINVFSNSEPIIAHFKLKNTRKTLLQSIMKGLEEHDDICAIQVWFYNFSWGGKNSNYFFT